MTNMGRLARHELERMSHPPDDKNLPSQVSMRLASFSTRSSHCSIESFLSEIGIPR
jgi:hypothetical protein